MVQSISIHARIFNGVREEFVAHFPSGFPPLIPHLILHLIPNDNPNFAQHLIRHPLLKTLFLNSLHFNQLAHLPIFLDDNLQVIVNDLLKVIFLGLHPALFNALFHIGHTTLPSIEVRCKRLEARDLREKSAQFILYLQVEYVR